MHQSNYSLTQSCEDPIDFSCQQPNSQFSMISSMLRHQQQQQFEQFYASQQHGVVTKRRLYDSSSSSCEEDDSVLALSLKKSRRDSSDSCSTISSSASPDQFSMTSPTGINSHKNSSGRCFNYLHLGATLISPAKHHSFNYYLYNLSTSITLDIIIEEDASKQSD